MTRLVAPGVAVIESEPSSECEYCGDEGELRPYGQAGAWICFTCGMQDEGEAQRQFNKRLGIGPDTEVFVVSPEQI